MTKAKKIKGYYDTKSWSKSWVKDAVKQGWITEAEYEEITGEKYAEEAEEN